MKKFTPIFLVGFALICNTPVTWAQIPPNNNDDPQSAGPPHAPDPRGDWRQGRGPGQQQGVRPAQDSATGPRQRQDIGAGQGQGSGKA